MLDQFEVRGRAASCPDLHDFPHQLPEGLKGIQENILDSHMVLVTT